jgi:hypothetical protein
MSGYRYSDAVHAAKKKAGSKAVRLIRRIQAYPQRMRFLVFHSDAGIEIKQFRR